MSSGNLISRNLVVDNNLARCGHQRLRRHPRGDTVGLQHDQRQPGHRQWARRHRHPPDNTITGNATSGNGFLNPFRRNGDGIRVFGGSDRTTVTFNQAIGNAANGIILHGLFGTRPGVMNSVVTDNLAVNNSLLPPIEQSQLGGPTFDLLDGNPGCDANVWLRNRFRTASPPCTTTAGSPV